MTTATAAPPEEAPKPLARGVRERPKNRRKSETIKLVITDQDTGVRTSLFILPGYYEDGRLAEIFIETNRAGSAMRETLRAFAIAVSLGLQYGVPLKDLGAAFIGENEYCPHGPVVGSPFVTDCRNLIDATFQWLVRAFPNQ